MKPKPFKAPQCKLPKFKPPHNIRVFKFRWQLLSVMLPIAIIPVILIVVFSSKKIGKHFDKKSRFFYANMIRQTAGIMDRKFTYYQIALNEITLLQNFKTIVNNPQYFTLNNAAIYNQFLYSIGEGYYNASDGSIMRRINSLLNCELAIIRIKDKSVEPTLTSSNIGFIFDNFHTLLFDPLVTDLVQDPDRRMVFGKLSNAQSVCRNDTSSSCFLYKHVTDNPDTTMILLSSISSQEIFNIIGNVEQLQFGTLYILDRNNNIIFQNHPYETDYYDYDNNNMRYKLGDDDRNDKTELLSFSDYKLLNTDPSILETESVHSILNELSGKKLEKNLSFSNKKSVFTKPHLTKHNGIEYAVIVEYGIESQTKYLYFLPMHQITKPIKELLRFIFGIGFLCIIIVIFFTLKVSQKFTKPIRVLLDASKKVEQGNYNIPEIKVDCRTELVTLAGSFNTMLAVIRDHINNLEEKVTDRTHELEESNERLKEMDRIKTNFFANISHEFRTPLTLILSPLEAMLAGDYGKTIDHDNEIIESVVHNSYRLLKLINNLLDLTRLEAGRMKLKKQQTDIVKLIDFYVSNIHSGAESKGLKLTFETELQNLVTYIDREVVEKIFFNLISNAIKFTPRGGSITVKLARLGDQFAVAIKDTGIGIPTEKQKHIFDRFIQVDGSTSREYEGSGIGLSFSQELADLHNGQLTVNSKEGKGATFIFAIPIGNETDVEKKDEEQFGPLKNYLVQDIIKPTIDTGEKEEIAPSEQNGSTTILVVEDNAEMRNFISSILDSAYTIVTAPNGKDGLKKAKEIIPDLILSDVMMPKMNGYEMCNKIKCDPDLTHIPIILITAKTELSMKLEGFKYGADDYLAKPFHSRELISRVKVFLKREDIRKQLENVNRELLEKSNFKSQYLANMSHEIRTPLNSIMGFIQLLLYRNYEKKYDILDINDELIELIEKNPDTALMLADILNFCKKIRDTIGSDEIDLKYTYYYLLKEHFSQVSKQHTLPDEIGTKITSAIDEVNDLLKEEDELIDESLNMTRKGGEYLLQLINTILDIAKIEAGKIEIQKSTCNVRELADEWMASAQSYAQTKGKQDVINLSINVADSVPETVNIDKHKISQVMLNLLSNAIKFTEQGSVSINAEYNESILSLAVSDSGVGIKPSEISLLFKEFSRTSSTKDIEGTGLGLALSKKIIELHCGTIEVISQYKKGSTFTIILPL